MATPATDPRDVVRRMWREAAHSDAVGSFRQVGGDSLSGLRLLGAIYKTLGVRLTWTDLDGADGAADFASKVAVKAE